MSSAVLHALKTVQEKIADNYTSGQLFDVLDTMLYRSIEPLIVNTRYVDRSLSIVLAWYAQNHRRKISPHSKRRLTAYIISFLSERDPVRRVRLYRRMSLERNITFFLVRHWLSIVEPWRALHVGFCQGHVGRDESEQLARRCCVTDVERLHGTISSAQYWLDQATQFKHHMVEKYMRLAMMDAYTHWTIQSEKNPHLGLDLEELAQNFILAVMKAIDKFDKNQGTLTAYVQWWLQNARITQTHRGEYGIAYTIPHSKRKSIALKDDALTRNISVSIDSNEALEVPSGQDLEGQIIATQEQNRVRLVAKYSDSMGIGRLVLGIPEMLSNQELQQLLSARVNEQ